MEQYYHNIGEKIKKLAQIMGIYGAVIYFIAGIITECVCEFEFCGLMILSGIVAGLINYISSWFIYAYGQITIDTHNTNTNSIDTLPEL